METDFKFNQVTIDQIKTQSVDVHLLHQALSKFATKDKIAFRWYCSRAHNPEKDFSSWVFHIFFVLPRIFLYIWDKEEKEGGCIIGLPE